MTRKTLFCRTIIPNVIFQYDCKYEHLSTKKQEYLDYYLDIFFYLRIVTMAENLPSMSYSLPLHNDTNDDAWCMHSM